jgi:hypothetical protein
MRRFLGPLAFSAGLGVLIPATGTPVARAAPLYEITVTITDLTTPAKSTSFLVAEGDPNDTSTNPNVINANANFLNTQSSASGLTFTALSADTTSATSGTQLNAHGTFTLSVGQGGPVSTDHYLVTILTTHDTYTLPPAATAATLSQSESGTYTFTTAGNTQTSQSWYSPTNTPNSTAPPGTPPVVIPVPTTGSSNASAGSPTVSTGIAPFVIPYALTNRMIIDVTGNDAGNPTVMQVNSATTLAAVPEPASLVVFLTGIPLPIVLVGLLRRRRAAA